MGRVLHGRATTTEAVRRAIQAGQASVRALAHRHGISPTTVQQWRARDFTTDAPMGPKAPRSTVLSPGDEAVAVALRRHTPLPLDDRLHALQPSLPQLTRSSLRRRLRRHGTARLPGAAKPPERSRFKAYPIGFFRIDTAGARTEEGRLYLLVAVDRTSKFAVARLHGKATRRIAADSLDAPVAVAPHRIHTILTDNGTQFVDRAPSDEEAEAAADAIWAARGEPRIWRRHAFDVACEARAIERRTTKPAHPWANGQVERMSRALKDATVRRYHYGSRDELRQHLQLFLDAHNHARRPKTLRRLTPYEFTCRARTDQPSRFTSDPTHYTLGPSI